MNRPHFLEYDPHASFRSDCPYAVLPLPYERTVSFGRGAARGPAAILAASVQTELFDEELRWAPRLRVQTLPAVNCRRGSAPQALRRIRLAAERAMQGGRFLLGLGGEHTVSAPLIAAARATFGRLSVLHMDAHLDLRDTYENTPHSHACVMRRVLEQSIPIVHVGIRSVCAEEYSLVKRRHLPVYWARQIGRLRSEAWMREAVERLTDRVYVSIDIDCLDTAWAPGTGTPEPGGLAWYTVLGLLRTVCARRRVVAADLVETAPIPGSVVTEYTAARLAAKLMTYRAWAERRPRAARKTDS